MIENEEKAGTVEAELVKKMGATGDAAPADVAEVEEVIY